MSQKIAKDIRERCYEDGVLFVSPNPVNLERRNTFRIRSAISYNGIYHDFLRWEKLVDIVLFIDNRRDIIIYEDGKYIGNMPNCFSFNRFLYNDVSKKTADILTTDQFHRALRNCRSKNDRFGILHSLECGIKIYYGDSFDVTETCCNFLRRAKSKSKAQALYWTKKAYEVFRKSIRSKIF